MSDMMQASRPPHYKSSKVAEGRLKLSTSCTECHRRKQKCDQKQPCRHCARRYPPPRCIYPAAKLASTSKEDSSGPLPLDPAEEPRSEYSPLTAAGTNKSNVLPSASPDGFASTMSGQENDDQQESKQLAVTTISIPEIDKFNAPAYQNLLNTMVSRISAAVMSGDYESNSAFLESQEERKRSFNSKPASHNKALINIHRDQRNVQYSPPVGTPSSFSISSVDPLHFLGITPTYESGELLHAFLTVITKYVFSIDGNVEPNYYNDVWVTWATKSPILVSFGIFTAACYQAEAQKRSPATSALVLRYKLKTISLLNEMLRNKETATSDEAITAVCYLITNEWYWSNYENVQAHFKGLREMVRLRGGIGDLGMNGFLRKMIIMVDYQISCSYDFELSFPHNVSISRPYPPRMSTPLLYSQIYFASIAEELQISKEVAIILDDMRFLTTSVVRQVDRTLSDDEISKLWTTSTWIQDRISAMPDGNDPASHLTTDYIYKACRIAALLYCKAIVQRTPLSRVCTMQDLNQLWANMWRVTLTRWKQTPGVFLWILFSANPAAQETPHGRFLKSMLKATSSYLALDYWDIVDGASMAYVKLQRWLRREAAGMEAVGVGMGVAKPERDMSFLHNYKR